MTAIPAVPPPASEAPLARRPFALPERVLAWGFAAFAIGGCFDYALATLPLQDAHLWYSIAFVAALAAFDRAGDLRARAVATAAMFLVGFLYSDLMRDFAETARKRREVLSVLFVSPSIYLWAATLWLGSPFVLDWGPARRLAARLGRPPGNPAPDFPLGLRLVASLMLAYVTLCFSSAVTSESPLHSLLDFHRDRGILFAPLLAWMRWAPERADARAHTARVVAWTLATTAVAAFALGCASLIGGGALADPMVKLGMVHREYGDALKILPAERFQFPMLHFNRTAYWALLALGVFAIASVRRDPPRRERWAFLLALPCVALIFWSDTRGGLLALAFGAAAGAAFFSRRVLGAGIAAGLATLVLAAAVVATMPEDKRSHWLAVLNPASYKPATYEEVRDLKISSMRLRIIGWKVGLEMIDRNPMTGVGYGALVVKRVYKRHARLTHDEEARAQAKSGYELEHLHNVWIEHAAESGLPALAVFAAFMFARWTMIARRFLAVRGDPFERRRVAMWIGAEAAIFAFGLIFYMLRRNFGFLTWFLWVWPVVEIAAESRRVGVSGD